MPKAALVLLSSLALGAACVHAASPAPATTAARTVFTDSAYHVAMCAGLGDPGLREWWFARPNEQGSAAEPYHKMVGREAARHLPQRLRQLQPALGGDTRVPTSRLTLLVERQRISVRREEADRGDRTDRPKEPRARQIGTD